VVPGSLTVTAPQLFESLNESPSPWPVKVSLFPSPMNVLAPAPPMTF